MTPVRTAVLPPPNLPRKMVRVRRVLYEPGLQQRDVLRFVKYLLCARHCSKPFLCISLFKSLKNPMRSVFLLSRYYRSKKETEAYRVALQWHLTLPWHVYS